jgi:hypothetical protein
MYVSIFMYVSIYRIGTRTDASLLEPDVAHEADNSRSLAVTQQRARARPTDVTHVLASNKVGAAA